MIGFAVLTVELAVAVRVAWRDQAFRSAALSLVASLVLATVFYRLHEGWSVIDSLSFSVLTGLTIGYGDVAPTTTLSKIFTLAYAVSTVSLFVTVGGLIARSGIRHRRTRRAVRGHGHTT